MDRKAEVMRNFLVDMVCANQHLLFGNRAVKQKQEVWKAIHAKLVDAKFINTNRDWKAIRQQWYHLTCQAKKSREQFLLGKIYDIPEFDKKVLMISGIPVAIEEETSYAVDRLNMENQREMKSLATKDHMEFTENKVLLEDIKSKEHSDMMEIDFLTRKVNEQKFKLQQCKLIKRKCEIYNIKDKNEREAFMKLL